VIELAGAASRLTWRDCPTALNATKQCAWLRVPRRYDRPNGPTLQIALARIPATGPAHTRIGSLVWDAGGPGGASTRAVEQIAERLPKKVRQRFDFVAFDPRGIGASRPALTKCNQPWPDRPAVDPLPAWGAVQRRFADVVAKDNRRCLRANDRLAPVMGTNNVARDLDVIRAALGDEKLTFWAASYGTRIGYVYALRYPERVRAMVMDGSIDPAEGYAGIPAVGGRSQDSALRFMRANARPLYRKVIRTSASLTARPVSLPGGERFTRWDWLDVVGGLTGFQSAWDQLTQAAALVETARGGGPEAESAQQILAEVKQGPNTNVGKGFSVVNCLDYPQRLSARARTDAVRSNAARAPVFGGSLTLMYAIGCVGLKGLPPDPVPLVTTAAQRARLAEVPVLLANATHDASTPMRWARSMQRVFDRPMIRYRGSQHVIWGAVRSRCVNKPITDFVLRLKMPRQDRTCAFSEQARAAALDRTRLW
jgi:pimeloyl-ACP methyl ester carboxylesterase